MLVLLSQSACGIVTGDRYYISLENTDNIVIEKWQWDKLPKNDHTYFHYKPFYEKIPVEYSLKKAKYEISFNTGHSHWNPDMLVLLKSVCNPPIINGWFK